MRSIGNATFTDQCPKIRIQCRMVVLTVSGASHPEVVFPIEVLREFHAVSGQVLNEHDAAERKRVVPIRKAPERGH